MRKIIAIFVLFSLLFSVAYADIFSDFTEKWNTNAYIYGTPEISDDMIQIDGTTYTITGSNWHMIVISSYKIESAEIYAPDGDTLLPLCVTAGVNIVANKTAQTFTQYKGNLLDIYLRVISGQSSRSSMFDTYKYTIEKTDDGFIFRMDD